MYTHPKNFSHNQEETKKGYFKFMNFYGKIEHKMGKDRHYCQQALKHLQQVYQVSVLVTNNVTTSPIRIFRMVPSKTQSHSKPKTNPDTL